MSFNFDPVECSICMDTSDNSEYGIAKCGHGLHRRCWKKWLRQRQLCPICLSQVKYDTLIRINHVNYKLLISCQDGELEALKSLLSASAEPRTGWQSFIRACDVLNIFTTPNAELSVRGAQGNTPLITAAMHDQLEIIEAIFQQSAVLIDEMNDLGETALMCAAARGQQRVVEYLVTMGSDKFLLSHEGKCALEKAAEGGHMRVIEFLIVGHDTLTIKSAIQYAESKGHYKVADGIHKLLPWELRSWTGYTRRLIKRSAKSIVTVAQRNIDLTVCIIAVIIFFISRVIR